MLFTDRIFLGMISPEANALGMPAGITAFALACFFTFAGGYTAAVASQQVGAGLPASVGRACWPGLWIAVVGGLVNLALIPFLPFIMGNIAIGADLHRDLVALTAWYMAAAGPGAITVAVSGMFSGTDRTRWAGGLAVAQLALNALFNWMLIFGHLGAPALGVIGSGIGTFLASSLTAAAALALLWSPVMRAAHGTARDWRPDWQRFWNYLSVAAPHGARLAIEIGIWTLFTHAVGLLGTPALVANNVVINWNLLTFLPMAGLGQAIAVTVGQAVGAGRDDLARLAAWQGLRLLMIYSALVAVLVVSLADPLIDVFLAQTSPNGAMDLAAVRRTCHHLIWVAALWGFGDALNMAFAHALAGAGDTRWPMFAVLWCAALLLLLPLSVVVAMPALVASSGLEPVVAAWLVTLLFVTGMGLVLGWRFRSGRWRGMGLAGRMG